MGEVHSARGYIRLQIAETYIAINWKKSMESLHVSLNSLNLVKYNDLQTFQITPKLQVCFLLHLIKQQSAQRGELAQGSLVHRRTVCLSANTVRWKSNKNIDIGELSSDYMSWINFDKTPNLPSAPPPS